MPNRGEGIWTADTRWSASVGLELGHLTADSAQQFGRVGAVVPDSRGNLYILDTQAQEIKVFSPEGEHLRNIGRSGEGPGEFGGAGGIAITPRDSIWVYDTGNSRFHLFDPNGELVRDVPRVARGVIASWPGGWDEEVGLLDWSFDRYGYGDRRQLNEITFGYFPLGIDLGSGKPDTFPTIERKYEVISNRYHRPFVGSVELSQPVGGAFWFAQTEEYRILKRRWSGDTIMIITREDASPFPVTNRDVDSMLELYRNRNDPPGRTPPTPPSPSDFMETKPILSRTFSDGVHLLVMTDEAGEDPGPAVDVFRESDGVFLGRLPLPVDLLGVPRPILRGDKIYGLRLGELDEPIVVRLDLQGPDG